MIQNVIEAMKARRSVRTYAGAPLSEAQKRELEEFISAVGSPFGGKATIRLIDVELSGPYRPGTYGVIRGARNYLVMGMADDEKAQLSAGFMMEQAVLKATEMGLGTCWIAATFRGSDFAKLAKMPADRPLRIVSPIGVAAEKKSLVERLTRTIARSSTRKPFGELFFEGDFSAPLSEASPWAEALEMMRIAPSSTNSQPWRAVVSGGAVHFYMKPGRYSLLDLGIGLSHFSLAATHCGIEGRWQKLDDAPGSPASLRYLISFVADLRGV